MIAVYLSLAPRGGLGGPLLGPEILGQRLRGLARGKRVLDERCYLAQPLDDLPPALLEHPDVRPQLLLAAPQVGLDPADQLLGLLPLRREISLGLRDDLPPFFLRLAAVLRRIGLDSQAHVACVLLGLRAQLARVRGQLLLDPLGLDGRKSTRLNSSHSQIS